MATFGRAVDYERAGSRRRNSAARRTDSHSVDSKGAVGFGVGSIDGENLGQQLGRYLFRIASRRLPDDASVETPLGTRGIQHRLVVKVLLLVGDRTEEATLQQLAANQMCTAAFDVERVLEPIDCFVACFVCQRQRERERVEI